MRSRSPYKPSIRAPRLTVVLSLAASLAMAAVAAPVALGQTGGAGPPGGTTPDPSVPTTPPTADHVFPVQGAHTFGEGFGASRGKRSHQGQDIMAACNTPLVAVSRAKVVFIGTQRSAGNYIVIRDKALHQDYAYMHLAGPPSVAKKQVVTPGQQIAVVGQTGNASTCHLHFEIWAGKWYRGGRAIDPLPSLTAWDAAS